MMASFPDNSLHDIHGLNGVPWWPLAPGWWYVIAIIVLVPVVITLGYWLAYYGPLIGWRSDARRRLAALRKALPEANPREVAGQLSELLRRIAMARSGRRVAAGLTGATWLHWLAEMDTSGFDWEARGQILLKAPYMPPSMEVERKELASLIRAAIRWIDATQPARKLPDLRNRVRFIRTGLFGSRGAGRV
jgi:hypothetical protein